jgi:hypothetical protein
MSRTPFICPVNDVQCDHPDCSISHCREATKISIEEQQFEQEVTKLMKEWGISDRPTASRTVRKIRAGIPLGPKDWGL